MTGTISLTLEIGLAANKSTDTTSGLERPRLANIQIETTLGKILLDIASDAITAREEHHILQGLARILLIRNLEYVRASIETIADAEQINKVAVIDSGASFIRRRLFSLGLLDISVERRTRIIMGAYISSQPLDSEDYDATVWKFTPEGKGQLLLLEGISDANP